MQTEKTRTKISAESFNKVSAIYEAFAVGLDEIIKNEDTPLADAPALGAIEVAMDLLMVELRSQVE